MIKSFNSTSITEYQLCFLRYADDTTLMAVSEEELKGLLMKVKVDKELMLLNCGVGEDS